MSTREWCLEHFQLQPIKKKHSSSLAEEYLAQLVCMHPHCKFHVEDKRGAISQCVGHLFKQHNLKRNDQSVLRFQSKPSTKLWYQKHMMVQDTDEEEEESDNESEMTSIRCAVPNCGYIVDADTTRAWRTRRFIEHLRTAHNIIAPLVESPTHDNHDSHVAPMETDETEAPGVAPPEMTTQQHDASNTKEEDKCISGWHHGLLAIASDLMLMTTSYLRHRTTLTDILTRSVDTLAREMEWEHNLVLSKQSSSYRSEDATPSSSIARLPLSALEFRNAARSVAWSLLVPPRVAPTKESLLHSLSTSTPAFDMSNASIAAVKATRESLAESILEALSSGAEDVDEVGRKRPRCDAPRTSPLCRIERFARNAFRGPYLNQVVATLHEGGDRDDISETESVVLLPNPDRLTRRRGGDKTCKSDEVELTPTTLHAYYSNTFGLRKDRAQLQSAHVSQLLANGVANWLKTNSRFELEALSAALYVPAVSLRLATSLELVNFITMSMLPTTSVGQLVHQAHAAFMEPLQRTRTEENWSLATEEAQPFRGGTTTTGTSSLASKSGSLSAIGSQSRSLESAQRHMSETILYGNKRAKPEPFSRGELLHQASQRCRIPLESIVSALAEFGSRGGDADLLPSHIGAPAMPSREEFDAMDADSKKQLYQSILRHQFHALGGCSPSTGIDLSYEAQRARHLAHVPLEALVVLVIATNTGDPYEQLMIRYYRIPFSPRTTKYELGQWLWNDEHVMLVGNLLSYVTESERFVAMRAAKVNVKILPLLLSMGSNDGDPMTGASEDCSIGKNNRNLVDLILHLLRGRNQSGTV